MLIIAFTRFLFAQKVAATLLLGLLAEVAGVRAAMAQTSGPAVQTTISAPTDLPPIPTGMQVEFAAPPKILLAESDLGDWDTIDFAGGGESSVSDNTLTIGSGEGLTGVYWDGAELPVNNYELRMQARRTAGIDFFCGPVFPVNDSHCCFIAAGWAGATVGLSNIDGRDASSNDTTKLMNFDDNRWYDIRIRVLPDRIIVWIDNQCVVYQNIVGKKVSLRGDTELCTPLGLCTFRTQAEIRKLTLQRIGPPSKTISANQPPKQ